MTPPAFRDVLLAIAATASPALPGGRRGMADLFNAPAIAHAYSRTASAVLSDERPVARYRYRLDRPTALPEGRTLAVIMVNPSTADAVSDDATIRKVLGFAQRLGAAHVIVGNKFAYRATDIRALRGAVDVAIGPDNDRHLEQIMRDADLHIVAWGPVTKLPKLLQPRWRDVVAIARRVGCPLHALAVANCGHPKHPLMLGYGCELTPWFSPDIPTVGRSVGRR